MTGVRTIEFRVRCEALHCCECGGAGGVERRMKKLKNSTGLGG